MALSLAHLNEPQRQAVLHGTAPLLVLAGAGTGKTSVITHRIAHFALERGVPTDQILAVTFTNKAAREMRERALKLLGDPTLRLQMGTFHRLSGQLLRRYAPRIGLDANFVIYDADDQLQLIKQCLPACNIDPQVHAPRAIRQVIETWKNSGKNPEQAQAAGHDATAQRAKDVYRVYQQRLAAANAVDFSDMLRQAVVLLEQEEDVRLACQRRWTHLLVDEYQDTNPVQYAWLKLLATPAHSLTVVGDDDQSIYRWRGADIGNILRFERDFPGASVIRLEENYRSTNHILNAANGVISHNAARKGKTLFSRQGDGERLQVSLFDTEREEAYAISESIAQRMRKGAEPGEIAILYRTNGQSRPLEDALRRRQIAYVIVGGVRFYDRKEVKDAMSYLRLLCNPRSDIDFLRIVNVPARGLGKTSLDKLRQAADEAGLALYDVCLRLQEPAFASSCGLTRRALAALVAFVQLLQGHRQSLQGGQALSELLGHVLQDVGYLQLLKGAGGEEADERLQNLEELSRALDEYEHMAEAPSLAGFLEETSLATDVDSLAEGGGQVAMMTLHAAKGLEFSHVFLPGLEEGLLPHSRSLNDRAGLEEERRLAYVGMTRAKRSLFVSAARVRSIYGQPQLCELSRFLAEIPKEVVARAPGQQMHDVLGALDNSAAAATAQEEEDSIGSGMRSRSSRRLPSRGFSKKPVPAAAADDTQAMPVGSRVLHATFGEGPVISIEGDGARTKLTIDFPEWGRKVVVARFLTPVQ